MAYKARSYRSWTEGGDLAFFEVTERETDLAIYAEKNLESQARSVVMTCREEIESYISRHREFLTSLQPVAVHDGAPDIVVSMADAARRAGVGPMAAVAGAIAQSVGSALKALSDEIIVENGGDIYIRTSKNRVLGIYAGENSPFTGKLSIKIGPCPEGLGVCTSSGTVSHSLSFGKSDAVVIISENTSLADAAATAVGNVLKTPDDIRRSIDFARSIDGVSGALVMKGIRWGAGGR